MEKVVRKLILQRLDLIAVSIGTAIGVIIILFSYIWGIQQQDIGIALLLVCIVYIVFRKRLSATSEQSSAQPNRTILLLTNIVFLATFAASILLLKLNLYHRPPAYFVLVSVAAASIAVEILYTSGKTSSVCLILFKVIILSLSIMAGIFYEFPTLMGSDTWPHAEFADFIAGYGHIPSRDVYNAGQYNNLPIFHIAVATTQLITSLSLKSSLFFSAGFISVISTMFIYLLGRSIGGVKLGLFAMLIVSVSDFMIQRAATNITVATLVLGWFMLILFLMFRQRSSVATISLMILLLFVIILTHQLTTFVILIALIGLLIGKKLYDYFYKNEEKLPSTTDTLGLAAGSRRGLVKRNHRTFNISLTLVLIFGISMLFYWMNIIPGEPGLSFFHSMASRIIRALSADVFFAPASSAYAGLARSYTMLSNVLFHPGYLILIFLAAMGVLIWFSPRNIDKGKVAIIVSLLLLYVFTYVSPLTSMELSVIPHRWLPFIYVFLTLVAAKTILAFISLIRRNWGKAFLVSAVTILLTFFMLTTPYISGDSPMYDQDRAFRSTFKRSEVQAAFTVAQVYEGNIMIDADYFNVFRYIVGDHNLNCERLKPNVDSTFKDMILLRKALLTEPTLVSPTGTFGMGRTEVLGEEFFEQVDQIPGANLIYNNGEVIVYVLGET